MAHRKTRVAVIGSGPAGLAAATRLLEEGGADRFRVRLLTMGHHIGGRAASWYDREGRLIDHGQHVIVGFYRELRALLRRAGVDVEAHLCSNEGNTYVYEPRDGRVHEIPLRRNPLGALVRTIGFDGLTASEKASMFAFTMRNLSAFLGLQSIDHLDDVCFSAWGLSEGLEPSLVQTRSFRMSREGQLNWPHEISAYSLVRSIQVMGRDYRMSEYSFCDGGMTQRFWEPVLQHFASLGGETELMRMLTGFRLNGRRLGALRIGDPSSGGHDREDHRRGRSPFEGRVPVAEGSLHDDDDFDHVICTVPAAAFRDLCPGDRSFWSIPFFRRIQNLRSVRPLALQVWHRAPVTVHYPSVIAGLEGPLPFVLDNKRIIREYRESPRYGAVLYFVGQETGYEDWTDEELLGLCLANVSRLPGYEQIDATGVLHFQVIRHHASHAQYFLTEPGVQRFRPTSRTPIENLWLAGDWVRNELDFPCMEAAVRSGLEAADLVLEAAS